MAIGCWLLAVSYQRLAVNILFKRGNMIGEVVKIEIKFGLGTKKIYATIKEYRGNGEYILEGDNGNLYLRKMVWEEVTE